MMINTFELPATNKKILDQQFVFGNKNQYQIEIANTLEKRKESYSLIYELYKKPEIGFAEENPSGMWYSLFYAHPDTLTLNVREIKSNEVIASLTAVVDTELGLPMETSYPNQIKDLRNKNKKCAEMISLGVHDQHKGNREILIQLIKFSYYYAKGIKGVTDYLIMICPKHAFFYEKKFLYKPIGEEKPCSKVKNKTVKLYNLDLEFAEEQVKISRKENKKVRSIFNYFEIVSECPEIVELMKNNLRQLNKHELNYLFQKQKNIFENANHDQLKILEKAYTNFDTKNYLHSLFIENSISTFLRRKNPLLKINAC